MRCWLAGDFLLSLFGPAFTAGYGVMVILLFGILAKAAVGPGEVLLTMAGQQTLCMVLYAVALAANIGLNIALIPAFGIVGRGHRDGRRDGDRGGAAVRRRAPHAGHHPLRLRRAVDGGATGQD